MKRNLIDERIVSDHKTYDGKPTVRNTRVAVEHVLGMMADGATESDILENYPFLEKDNIRICIHYSQHNCR